ncbi:thiol reductant ABC exporter subunit CydD [Lederbergia sp. NSJ-179]|uniref:thiol reductant ABC exporter subunit CydD n=1 Tax=Lederbergia sp. NSJ-179 TaxID=2931402 RepID=UPI001FD219C4|nr:thiol reductant ABC exporter subunit CydD [Lederbergia sp. NSJ-179]MCJ7843335.1 thiol reductant ABC exporter subunit CydD [Lederbergia sp. NSJ-179]
MDKHLLHYKGSKRLILIIGFLTVAQAIVLIVQANFLSDAIVKMYKGTAWKAVLFSFAVFLIAFVFRHFLQWVKEKLAYHFAEKTANDYQGALLEKVFALGPRAVGKEGTGNLVTLTLEGVPQFRTYLRLFIPRTIAMACVPVTLFIYVAALDLPSAIILAVVMPIMIIFLILLGLAAQKQMDAQWGTYQLLSRHFVDSLRGLLTLKYLGKSKEHQKSIKTVSHKYRIATNRTLRVAFLSTFSLDFFASLSVAIVAVELGLRLINGHILLGPALLILILAPEYFLPVRELGNDYHATMDGKEAGDKIHQLLAMESVNHNHDEEAIPAWTEMSILQMNQINKETEEGLFQLKDIRFAIQGFTKVGIVGPSGAGKSTLIDLLSGFSQPTGGEIQVNKQVYSDLSCNSWQNQLTYIPQHPYIFSGTVAENISWYAPNASLEEMEQAARKAGLVELIARFPKGLHEKIGQGGRNLSGGEEQRIALARGLLQNRPIMLFDEPTAHLDIETEYELKQAMLPLMEQKLVFFATHRLHWMREMDWILVLENGRLVESGRHEDLLKQKGAYFQLQQAHKGGAES